MHKGMRKSEENESAQHSESARHVQRNEVGGESIIIDSKVLLKIGADIIRR